MRDGDDFIITGQKVFVGDSYKPDWLWALAVTDPDAPRHQKHRGLLHARKLARGINRQPEPGC